MIAVVYLDKDGKGANGVPFWDEVGSMEVAQSEKNSLKAQGYTRVQIVNINKCMDCGRVFTGDVHSCPDCDSRHTSDTYLTEDEISDALFSWCM